MNIISFINPQLGAGKTTLIMNIGTSLVRKKKKVLLLDLDPHYKLTTALGINTKKFGNNLYSVLTNSLEAKKAIVETEFGLHIIPTDLSLSKVRGNSNLLKEKMIGLFGYDFILIDTSSNNSFFTFMALIYSNQIYFVMKPKYSSLRTLNYFSIKVKELRRKIDRIIINQYEKGNDIHNEITNIVKFRFNSLMFRSVIRNNDSLAESFLLKKTIFNYKPKSNSAIDIQSLTLEMLQKH